MSVFTNLEFHRTGIGLVPTGPGQTQTAIYVERVPGSSNPLRSCTCASSKKKTCDHVKELAKLLPEVQRAFAPRNWEAAFEASLWHRLARLLFEGNPQASARVRVLRVARGEESVIRVTSPKGDELAEYLDPSPARVRFLERTGKAGGDGVFDRAGLLERLALHQATEQERLFQKAGMKTQRQTWEESFWYRLAYHCVRELEGMAGRGTFHPAVDETDGRFTFTYHQPAGEPVVRFAVPRDRVRAALQLLAAEYPEQEDLAVRPIPLMSIFRVTQETELDLEVRPVIRALQENGEERFWERSDFEKFRYGNLIWIRELGVLAELEREGKERKFKAPVSMKLKRSQIPGYLDEHREALGEGLLVLDEPLRDRRIFKEIDRVEISALDLETALERSWYWLAVEYGFGSETVSLARILEARREGLPYLETANGWIDLNAPVFRALDGVLERVGAAPDSGGDRLRLGASDILRLQAETGRPVRVAATGEVAALLGRLLELRPAEGAGEIRGLATPLRAYQRIGLDWLLFLWENRLAGLLCDDMGLGKTLQTIALMAVLLERDAAREPFLVACPTSVLSHWRHQIERHAPGVLRPIVHHGAGRRLPGKLQPGDVLLTSYGVLRRDAEALSAIPFSLAVFDEVQNLKNRGTQAHEAADHLVADVKLGLTGTPIENSLGDLKTLFDLVLPNYLGSDAVFEERWGRLDGKDDEDFDLAGLRRVISPFILRRLKSAVLDELPEKIEDLRTCQLSDDQVRLYRDALAGQGADLARQIETAANGRLPYIHIFALLNLLKRICDHPALALKDLARAEEYASGKWDLYREILGESLDSGQKVVVFTEFLGMIELMERHLEGLGVCYARLTGASVRRGEIVDRFNQDPDCRVFLSTLKTGGAGIDLIAGSVVIHYDRWWNAAREDQATDRVHRMGQRRAVQVFKLVTEGTLEEKIAAIIDRKRRVMASIVQEDDPHLAKIFTRDELLEMLRGE